jgi:hypothetical protein
MFQMSSYISSKISKSAARYSHGIANGLPTKDTIVFQQNNNSLQYLLSAQGQLTIIVSEMSKNVLLEHARLITLLNLILIAKLNK